MSRGPLEVVVVEGEEPVADAVVVALGRMGHDVSRCKDVERALACARPDVFVCGARGGGVGGLELLEALRDLGERTWTVLLLSDPTVEDCLRAHRLGPGRILTLPFRLPDLVDAVEACPATPTYRALAGEHGHRLERAYPMAPGSVDACARDLCAFAMLLGVPGATRARLAGAACEILENARRHGRTHERVRVRAVAEGRWLRLTISDDGVGFDPAAARLALADGPATTGLARAMALSDSMKIESVPGCGASVEMRFFIAPAGFLDEPEDLSDADYLRPRDAKAVLAALLDGELPDVSGVSPAMAVVLGRLLAGPATLGAGTPRTPQGGLATLP